MPISSCRVCGKAFFEGPLLHYGNMPSSAQNFPDAASLAGETGAGLTVRQCAGCGLVQLENDPVPYYKDVIRAAAVSPVLRDLKTAQFAEFIRKYSLRGKKIVEIGCGRGEFLGLLPPLGVDAFGLEYSEAAVRDCVKAGLKAGRGYPDDKMAALAEGLTAWPIKVKGPRPFAESMVTAGGVSLDEVNPRTMESQLVPGLYLCGEVMDLDAGTGGYNLQAAFSTGYVAADSAAAVLIKQ